MRPAFVEPVPSDPASHRLTRIWIAVGCAQDTLASIGQPLNWIANLIVSTFFPIVFAALGRYAYLIFIGLTFFFGWFTFNFVPETKGRSIAEVTKEFEKY